MIKHTSLNLLDFQQAIKETETFKNFETFKKGIVIKRKNAERLHDYYQQAVRNGLPYIQQNPNVFGSEVKLISEIMQK